MSETDNSDGIMFEILKSALGMTGAARLGRFALPKRHPIETPSFLAITSRGTVPHLTPDNVKKHTSISGAYVALEDFIERKEPPIFNTPDSHQGPLHAFTCFPRYAPIILAARRCPAVTAPAGNGADFTTIFTSTGFVNLKTIDYVSAIETLRPDVAILLADLPHTSDTPPSKRAVRMVERTEEWVNEFFREAEPGEQADDSSTPVFAPILPLPYPVQWEYLNSLGDKVAESISGLALYDVDLIPDLDHHKSLLDKPRLSMDPPASPHQILRQVSLGVDIFIIPFINATSDAGVGMDFSFPPPETPSSGILPLGVDMWSADPIALTPLKEGCQCYTCTNHHRAYLTHLLNAKEMLGWTLLQIHNYHIMSEFFTGIRTVLNTEPSKYDEYCKKFAAIYETEFPIGSGQRPRARGYHFKSEADQKKINQPTWKTLVNGEAEITSLPD